VRRGSRVRHLTTHALRLPNSSLKLGQHSDLFLELPVAEASGSRTHQRQGNLPPAGFEDREDHRTPCASASILLKTPIRFDRSRPAEGISGRDCMQAVWNGNPIAKRSAHHLLFRSLPPAAFAASCLSFAIVAAEGSFLRPDLLRLFGLVK